MVWYFMWRAAFWVTAVATDMSDYNSAVRKSLREAARGGVRVRQSDRQVFASGITRRVDTVVRQNVLDAVSAISNEMSLRGGELFGADGVEISAHALCAEDHLPYQGEQFTNDEFDRLQMDLDRPFGFWNCRHTLYPIVVGVTEPAHTREELEAFRAYSTEEIEFDGKKLTRYEWTQEQRKIETEIRYLKDEQIAFGASGDDLGRRRAQDRINAYQEYYKRMSAAAGLRYEDRRMAISGFHRVKAVTLGEPLMHTLSAKSRNWPDVKDPFTGEEMRFVPNSRPIIPEDHTMAGFGCKTGRQIDDIDRLMEDYKEYEGLDRRHWQKEKARYAVYDEVDNERQVELHWYYHPAVGKVEHKVKLGPRGQKYVDDWN